MNRTENLKNLRTFLDLVQMRQKGFREVVSAAAELDVELTVPAAIAYSAICRLEARAHDLLVGTQMQEEAEAAE